MFFTIVSLIIQSVAEAFHLDMASFQLGEVNDAFKWRHQ